MRISPRPAAPWTLVTGAAGFVGAGISQELIRRGHRVLGLVRAADPTHARQRLSQALLAWSPDVEALYESGRLAAVRGGVLDPLCGLAPELRARLRGSVRAVVHAAGSVRFHADADGEPTRTNVEGTRTVFELARELACTDWHFLSTAFVAGAAECAYETTLPAAPRFRNVYEQSKWTAEQAAAEQAGAAEATLTLYRPSIVVGHSATGRAARFTGIYYLFRATSLLARAVAQQGEIDRHAVGLHIGACSAGRPNLICSDDVAAAFGELFDQPLSRGGVYHLTHPAPPTNAQIKRALEAYYDLGGGRFADDPPGRRATADGDLQRLFDEIAASVGDYLFDAPRFDRTQIDRYVTRPPAPWTDERLTRLIGFAETAAWRTGAIDRRAETEVADVAAYFREFLPARLAVSGMGRVRNADLAVRFEIGPSDLGRWWCRFAGGRLAAVELAAAQPWDVRYRTSASRFRAAVAGEISGAELFLSGEAHVAGDIERALKFAMLLEDFVRDHPYRPAVPCRSAALDEPRG